MKSMICMCLVAIMAALAAAHPNVKYTENYDDMDIQEALNNAPLFTHYFECLLGKTTICTPAAKELKENLQDALETDCEKCSEKQKKGAKTVIQFLINKKPEAWKELCDKYDPEQKYAAKYEEKLKDLQA